MDATVDDAGSDAGDSGHPGCTSNAICGARFFCRTPDEACGSVGTCEARPTPSECATVGIAPVCGCNGVAYDSSCAAHQAGDNVRVVGSCPTP